MLHLVGLIKNKYVRLKTHVINDLKYSLILFCKVVSDGVEKICKFWKCINSILYHCSYLNNDVYKVRFELWKMHGIPLTKLNKN